MTDPQPRWTEGFQRTAIASALRAGLLSRVGTSFQGSLFGPPTAPRARIAHAIALYWEKFKTAPANGELDEMLSRERMSEHERVVLSGEWAAIQSVPVSESPKYIEEQILDWVARQAIIQALLAAADRAETGDLGVLRQTITEGIRAPDDGQDVKREWTLVGDVAARVAMWRSGQEYGDPIPTGFPELDRALSGGPRRGEVHYFLAPPKGAKTTALTNIALAAARRRFNVYLVTCEMRAHRILLRADRTLTRSTRDELRGEPERLERAVRGLLAAGSGEIWAWESPPQTAGICDEIVGRIEKLEREQDLEIDLVVLDYLNIMGSSTREREKRHELARISREIAMLARHLDVVTWTAALVKREAVNQARARKEDVAEAYEVIAVADGVTAICGTREMREAGLCALYQVAQREEEDEREAGTYRFDRARGIFMPFYEQPGE